eukprot:TRINITY_DN2532_c0_g1_i1.p1 TRINITY_DN2532_c0_g1~~TRINITY_DN2532_c0_g1_i1.p1  ORF type:complete len:314 (+),score=82.35 TRINITY_DN2532_c0_g1_i1:113-1054(+)
MTSHSAVLTHKELLGEVFRHLEIEDLWRAALVCKLWNRVTNSDFIWRNFYFNFQPPSSDPTSLFPSLPNFGSSSTAFPWKSAVRTLRSITPAFTITGVTSQGFRVEVSTRDSGGSLYAWEPLELDFNSENTITTNATAVTPPSPTETELYQFEMKVLKRHFAMAIGVVVVDEGAPSNPFSKKKDPEYQVDFYGYYHGGGSRSFVWDAERHEIESGLNSDQGDQVGVLIDKTRRRLRLVSNGVISEEWTTLPTGVDRGGKRRVPKGEGDKKGRVWVIPTIWTYQKGDEMFVFFPRRVKEEEKKRGGEGEEKEMK